MIGTLRRMLIGLLSSLSGIGTAAIGGLPGPPKPRRKGAKLIWISWGGRHRKIHGTMLSQQAFSRRAYREAYDSLDRLRGCIIRGQIKVEAKFKAQLYNNLAVSAHELSQCVDDASEEQRLRIKAWAYIKRAARIPISSREISAAIRHNRSLMWRT
jgi:hypothetical protein